MKNLDLKNIYRTGFKAGLFICLCLTGATPMLAQEAEEETAPKSKAVVVDENLTPVTGVVVDAIDGTPLAGVRVEALNYGRFTSMTGGEGTFTIKLPSYVNALYVSTPGYTPIQIALKKGEPMLIKLYTQGLSSAYENATTITSKNSIELGITNAPTIETEIGNRMGADVRTITRSGAPSMGAMMLIRGIHSLNAGSQPLVVIDGVITDMQEDYTTVHSGFYNNVLAAVDINDIDKVEVLKNATSLYGAKGANGVILITTKRGKSMATRITANIYGGYSLQPSMPDMMNASQYRIYANEMLGTLTTDKTIFPFLSDKKDYYYQMYHNNTDWTDYVYREAYEQNYKVNVEGGDDIAMYNFSLGYASAEGNIKNNDFDRLNIRFNSDIKLAKDLSTVFDISYARTTRDLRDDGAPEEYVSSPISSPGFLSLIKAPFLHPYKYTQTSDATGVLTNSLAEADNFSYGLSNKELYSNSSFYNPLTILQVGEGENKNAQEYTQFIVSVAPKYVYKDWTFSTRFNYTLHRMNEKYYLPIATTDSKYYFYIDGKGKSQNEVRSFFAKENVVFSDTRVQWKKNLKAHQLDVFGGFRYVNFTYDSNYITGHNTGNDKAPDVASNLAYKTVGGDNNEWTNMAYYLNADYNYAGKYFLQGTATMESSSRFGKHASDGIDLFGVRWGLFPSVQAGWLVSSESWFHGEKAGINYLKLRAGYDITGNDDIDFYAARSYFETKQFYDRSMTTEIGNVGNESIQWETTGKFNVGLDAMLFNNRLGLSFDYYDARTSNLLTLKSLSYLSGKEYYWCNGGELSNKGFEVAANLKVIDGKNFKWELGASVAHYKNEVTALDEAIDPIDVYGGQVITAVGMPVGSFYGYRTNGVYATEAEAQADGLKIISSTGEATNFHAGDVRFVDVTPDGRIDENDKTVIGDANPDFYGNIYTTLVYKNFTLNVLFNYSVGNDVYNYLRQQLEQGSNFFNQTTALLNRWSYEGHQTDVPRITYGDPMGNSRFSDRWIEDGSYLKLKQVKLSYQVPVPATWNWLQGLTIWGAANNLFTATKYLGSDPEFSCSNNVYYQGIDCGLVPQTRSFHLGLKINL